MLLAQSYTMASQAPPAMAWREYEQLVLAGWEALLASSPTEKAVQQFLEVHPCMVPGPSAAIGYAGHGVEPPGLITQPTLPAFTSRIPDFLWIGRNSAAVFPILIEIESPGKRWFTAHGAASAQLTQALGQIHEWKAWFADHHNVASFLKYYGVETHARPLLPRYILVHGRRSEFETNKALVAKRAAMETSDIVLMTYDRLVPDRNAVDVMTVKLKADGYHALFAPPTLELGPNVAEGLARIAGKQDAVLGSPYFTDERRAFMVERLTYWDNWVQTGSKGIRNLGHRE